MVAAKRKLHCASLRCLFLKNSRRILTLAKCRFCICDHKLQTQGGWGGIAGEVGQSERRGREGQRKGNENLSGEEK